MKPFDSENNSFILRNYHQLLLYFIFVVGAVFRIYGFWDWSLTNDELSALHRLTVDSLSELIDQGIKPDGHPAVTQLFLYYWVKLFGNSVFAVRFPFVVSGIGSLIFFYYAAKNWFNKKSALLATIVFACSQFLILYAQIARPYTFGLFFLMAFNYYWSREVFKKKANFSTALGFVVFAALGIMTHYFATLSIMLQMFIGFFFISKSESKHYFIHIGLTALLCLPHLGISLQHLQIGGLGWLPQPNSEFYVKFIQFSFNHSLWWIALIAMGLIIPFASQSFDIKWKRILAMLSLAFLPFWIGYAYSINYTPVLQRSVMIFSFPFLILLFFSFIGKKIKPQLLALYYILLLVVGAYGLIQTNILKEKPFANFEAVANHVIDWKREFGAELLSFSNANNAYYFDYYLTDSLSHSLFTINEFRSAEEIVKAKEFIENTDKDYLSLSFGVFPIPLEVYEIARKKFPEVIERKRYYISEALLLAKGKNKRKVLFETQASTKHSKHWNFNNIKLTDSSFYSAPTAFQLKSKEEYPLTFQTNIGNVSSEKNRWINIEFLFKSQDTCNLALVVDVSRSGESFYWRSFETKAFYKKKVWSPFIAVWERPGFVKDEDEISIFIWNLNHCNCMLDDFSIRTFADSDYNYY